MIGRVIDSRFQLEKRLGSGAMGSVYRARHINLGRMFALKILHEDLLEDSKLKRRFVREAELAGTLSHPNIVTVTDVGETPEGLHYIAMEYAEGPTLGEIMERNAPIPAPRAMMLIAQILDGLHHAHQHGLIHRDFKPDNVIVVTELDGKESPRIADFGIAVVRDDASSEQRERLTTAGITLGTPHYMAPEHVTGQAIDHRIDLFALGVVIFEMLCGRMPFDGDGVDVARANLFEETPYMAERSPMVVVDPLLEAFTRKLMSKAPDARPPTAKDARALLDLIALDRAQAAAVLGVAIDDATTSQPAPVLPAPATSVSSPRPSPIPPGSVPRYGTYTPPTPYIPVARPVAYSRSGQHAIVEPMRDPTGPMPVAIAPAPTSRTRSVRVSQAPLSRTDLISENPLADTVAANAAPPGTSRPSSTMPRTAPPSTAPPNAPLQRMPSSRTRSEPALPLADALITRPKPSAPSPLASGLSPSAAAPSARLSGTGSQPGLPLANDMSPNPPLPSTPMPYGTEPGSRVQPRVGSRSAPPQEPARDPSSSVPITNAGAPSQDSRIDQKPRAALWKRLMWIIISAALAAFALGALLAALFS